MSPIISVERLTRRFGDVHAVDDVSFELDGPGIHGLLGRNGAGKTTLMQLLTGQDFPSRGEVRVFGENPAENPDVLRRVCFIKENQSYPDDFRGRHVFATAPWFFENWDAEFAGELIDKFELPLRRPIKKMSRGQRSAVGVILGLASRSELTLLDEPYAGLDAVARQTFYDALLADFAEHPRTVVLSTHLIDEAANLLERVLVIHRGRLVIDDEADDLRASATSFAGAAAAVDAFAAGRKVIDRSQLGGLASVTLADTTAADRAAAKKAGLEATPMSLQGVIVSRTGTAAETKETVS